MQSPWLLTLRVAGTGRDKNNQCFTPLHHLYVSFLCICIKQATVDNYHLCHLMEAVALNDFSKMGFTKAFYSPPVFNIKPCAFNVYFQEIAPAKCFSGNNSATIIAVICLKKDQ